MGGGSTAIVPAHVIYLAMTAQALTLSFSFYHMPAAHTAAKECNITFAVNPEAIHFQVNLLYPLKKYVRDRCSSSYSGKSTHHSPSDMVDSDVGIPVGSV